MKAAIYTLGCRVNQYESSALAQLLKQSGYKIVSVSQSPDVIIINSCTVTAESDRKSRQHVRSLRRSNPDAIIVLAGCMPQAFPEKVADLSEADIVLGNSHYNEICDAINKYIHVRSPIIMISEHKSGEKFMNLPHCTFGEKTRAYIKIEDGCDRFCTYCIIPKARGRVRSKNLSDIAGEAEYLAEHGYCDITLTGINLTAFGKENGLNICDAVECVSKINGIKRIRFGSLEPDDFDDALISRLAQCKKLCPHFHLSLQSGCDRVLRRMNRHYDTSFYRSLCEKLRKVFVDCSITTDIMVGFPGESEQDFDDSLNFVKDIGFMSAHVFSYSRRSGTPAAGMEQQVKSAEKARRSRLMIAAANESRDAFLSKMIGSTYEVLAESQIDRKTSDNFSEFFTGAAYDSLQKSVKGAYIYSGFTSNYADVRFLSNRDIHGQLVNVKITGLKDGCLIGAEI